MALRSSPNHLSHATDFNQINKGIEEQEPRQPILPNIPSIHLHPIDYQIYRNTQLTYSVLFSEMSFKGLLRNDG